MQLGLGIAFVTLVYLALIVFTKPIGWGDTIVYALQISAHAQGAGNPGDYWDFAHLFWRPLNYLFWHAGQSHWSQQFPASPVVQIFAAMRMLNLLVDYLAVLAGFAVAWKVSRSVVTGALVTAAFLCWNPFVNFLSDGLGVCPGAGSVAGRDLSAVAGLGPVLTRSRLGASACCWLSPCACGCLTFLLFRGSWCWLICGGTPAPCRAASRKRSACIGSHRPCWPAP